MTNNQERRYEIAFKTLVAFLAAAVVPTIISACTTALSVPATNFIDRLGVFVFACIYSIGVAAAISFLLGLPAFLLGLRLHVINWWSCTIVGFLIGLAPFTVYAWTEQVQSGRIEPNLLSSILASGLFGLSGGVVFWLAWRYWVQFEH